MVAHDDDPLRKVELLHQVADLHDVHLEQPRQAFDAYARAFTFDNQHDGTLEALERLAEHLGAWADVAKLYDAQINSLTQEDPEAAIDLALRLAQIFEVQLGDVENAIARYRVVFDADPGHLETLAALDRLFEATGRWGDRRGSRGLPSGSAAAIGSLCGPGASHPDRSRTTSRSVAR
jgi:tetratricopeptide (TPR) repeat protein